MAVQTHGAVNLTTPTSQPSNSVLEQFRLLSRDGIRPDSRTFEELLDAANHEREYVCVGNTHLLDLADVFRIDRGGIDYGDINWDSELRGSRQRPKHCKRNFWLASPQQVRCSEPLFFYKTTVTEGIMFAFLRAQNLSYTDEVSETHVFLRSQVEKEKGDFRMIGVSISKQILEKEAKLKLVLYTCDA